MDEILIEDKRYISSKQAAKITGYAKDYIGQLCREGRVQARLVGRSWYVLDSAIKDHRFGNTVESEKETPKIYTTSVESEEISHIKPLEEEILPSIEKIKSSRIAVTASEKEADEELKEEISPIQDSWRAWFDQINEVKPVEVIENEGNEEEVSSAAETLADTVVPVRAIHHSILEPKESSFFPTVAKEGILKEKEIIDQSVIARGGSKFFFSIKIFSVLLALTFIILAALGTGYFDSYLISSSIKVPFSGLYVQ
jgi:hypothetical protein